MANEALIVEVVQFICTKQCEADPSLFEAVRNIVQRWHDKGMKGQYWGTVIGKPNNIYWVLFWQSHAHAAAFAADPSYPEFVQKRMSLATTPVRDHRLTVSGAPLPCIEAPVSEVDFYKTRDFGIEETHEMARNTIHIVRSLQARGFHGCSFGVAHDDRTVGVYLGGWDSEEDHMNLGMEEGHEKFRELSEEAMEQLADLVIVHVVFKKHGA